MPYTVSQEYKNLESKRSVVLSRAEEYSAWTLTSIMPLQGTDESTELQNDIQSFGAQAVNHLSNKLMIGLFSPSRAFFRLEILDAMLAELAASGVTSEQAQAALQAAERESVKELDRLGAREPFTLALMMLIILGNCLLHFPKEGKITVRNLRDYVIKRDLSGFPIRIITFDKKRFDALPRGIQNTISATRVYLPDEDVELYTDIVWDHERQKYLTDQYTEEHKVTITQGVDTPESLEYLPLTWKLLRGEDYGRGLVEDYSGDFHSMVTGEESFLEIMGVISQIKGLVNPAGVTDVNELNKTPNGQWCSGREEDIGLLQFRMENELSTLQAFIDKKERRLSKAFLMDQASIRDAERVTAEEIRLVARDLEMSLGGVFTRLAQSFQLPIARLLLQRIGFKIGDKFVEPIIITGLDALSRNGDLDTYRLFVQDAALLNELSDAVLAELSLSRILGFIATNNNFDRAVAFKTTDEKALEASARRAQTEQAINDDVKMTSAPKVIAEDAKQNRG